MDIKNISYWIHSSKTKFVLVSDESCPLISIDIWCKAGISFEKKNQEGIAHFLEHMIFKGSNKLKPGEFDYKIESLGGSSNASTGYDDAHYYVLIPPDKLEESLSLLTNLVFNPTINLSEFKLEKSVVIEEIRQQNDQPEEVLFNYFLERVWKCHFYGKTILGKEEQINQINVKDLKDFHHERYTVDKACIALAGNLPKDIIKILENTQINYQTKKNIRFKNTGKYNFSISSGREIATFQKLKFSRIFMAWEAPRPKDQRSIIGLEILASILVDGRNSKLVRPLKEEENLIESIDFDLNTGEFGSIMILEACCFKENLNLVEQRINEILKNLLDKNIFSNFELTKAKRIVKSNYFFNLETASQKSSFFGSNFLWNRKDPIKNLDKNLNYWNTKNLKKILNFLSKKKYTLLAQGE
tara:strand:- start:3057 stop:4298 length:1242 start_codon:yes stop_codon:yes gene_type:complete